ncbi:MAG TPA: hypothetical protein VIK72_10000 [Clostridiaceae bacterium]
MIAGQGSFSDTSLLGKEFGIMTINGIEYVERDGILCVGINRFITGSPQQAIDDCAAQGGFTILCHPNWLSEEGLPPALTKEEMKLLIGYTGIEILTPAIFNRFWGSGLATDFWDELLTQGKLVWGFAGDDAHTFFDVDRGWNVLYSNGSKYDDLKEAIIRGSFYASSGLWLKGFSFENYRISLEANFPLTCSNKIHYRFIGKGGKTLYECISRKAEYHLKPSDQYVRVEAVSENGAMLWTQPIYNNETLNPLIG